MDDYLYLRKNSPRSSLSETTFSKLDSYLPKFLFFVRYLQWSLSVLSIFFELKIAFAFANVFVEKYYDSWKLVTSTNGRRCYPEVDVFYWIDVMSLPIFMRKINLYGKITVAFLLKILGKDQPLEEYSKLKTWKTPSLSKLPLWDGFWSTSPPTTRVICSPTIEMKDYPATKGTILDGDCITSAGFVATMPCDLIDFPTSEFLERVSSFILWCVMWIFKWRLVVSFDEVKPRIHPDDLPGSVLNKTFRWILFLR